MVIALNELKQIDPLRSPDRIVVLGGGITGLAAANRLLQAHPGVQVTLVEASDRLGGKIATEHVDGFVIEAGPDSFLATKPRGVGMCRELGLFDRLQGVTPRRHRAYILFRDRLHVLPEGLSGLVPTLLAPLVRTRLLSPAGKARVALDYVLPARRGDGDESVGAFIRRRLGDEAWERLVEPLMAGIYAADGDRLSLDATFPQLAEAERRHRGLIRGVLASRRAAPTSPPTSAFLTPKSGLGELVQVLEERLRRGGADIRLGTAASSISPRPDGYTVRLANGDSIAAAAVVVATPAFVSAELLSQLDATLAAELRAIPHASTALVSLAYRRDEIPHPLEGHGYVVPRVEGSSILACTWSSRKWGGRAPDGWELIRVFIGRSGNDEALAGDDDDLIALARQELGDRLGATARPALTRVQRWTQGMPQYLLGHPQRLERIENSLVARPGLFLAGSGYYGAGLPDCIASGERAADAVLAHLRTPGRSLALERNTVSTR